MKGYSLNVHDRRRGEKKIKEDSSRCKYPTNIPKFCCIHVHQSTLKLSLIDRIRFCFTKFETSCQIKSSEEMQDTILRLEEQLEWEMLSV